MPRPRLEKFAVGALLEGGLQAALPEGAEKKALQVVQEVVLPPWE